MKTFKITLGPGVEIGIHDLLDDNLLVIAMRRSGKTMRLRSIAEQVGKHMPIYVFDHEGEFASLREELPILICGENGEVPARPETAGVLARRLVEMHASAVLDISTLMRKDKRLFVMAFLQSMIDLPRKLWGPRLIVLDEIHEFCPQGGKDVDAQARETVNQLMALGGKRGLGVVAGTQRIAKLDKDSAAEFGNVCVGRTTFGGDVARACERLDFTREQGAALKKLKKGEMYAAGTSFEFDEAKLFQGILAKTTHPASAGQRRAMKPPPPNKAILKYASELKDLQRVADVEKATQKSLAEENARLKAEVEQLRARKPAPATPAASSRSIPNGRDRAPQPIDTKIFENRIAHARQLANLEGRQEILAELGDTVERIRRKAINLSDIKATSDEALADLLRDAKQMNIAIDKARQKTSTNIERVAKHALKAELPVRTTAAAPVTTQRHRVLRPDLEIKSDTGSDRILSVLATHGRLDRSAIRMFAAIKSEHTLKTYLQKLLRAEYIIRPDDDRSKFELTDEGRKVARDVTLPTGAALVEYWLAWSGPGGRRAILEVVLASGNDGITPSEIAQRAGITSEHTLKTYLQKLQTAGIIVSFKHDGQRRFRSVQALLEAAAS